MTHRGPSRGTKGGFVGVSSFFFFFERRKRERATI